MAALRNVKAFKGFQWSTFTSILDLWHVTLTIKVSPMFELFMSHIMEMKLHMIQQALEVKIWQHHHNDSHLRPYHQPFLSFYISRMWRPVSVETHRNPWVYTLSRPLRWAGMFRGRLGDFCPSCGKSWRKLGGNIWGENPSKDHHWSGRDSSERIHCSFFWAPISHSRFDILCIYCIYIFIISFIFLYMSTGWCRDQFATHKTVV